MKFNKDTLTVQPSDAIIENVVAVSAAMNVTHIAHATLCDGSTPRKTTRRWEASVR